MKKIVLVFLGLTFLYFPVQPVSSNNGLPLDVRMESLNNLAGRFSGKVELSDDAIEGSHSLIVHTGDDPYNFANYYPTPQSEIDTDVYRYIHIYIKPRNNAQWVRFHVWDVSDDRWENINSDLRRDGTFRVGEELISNQWNSVVLDLKQTNSDGVDKRAKELHMHTNEFADWQWDHIYTKDPKFTRFGLLGAVGVHIFGGFTLDQFFGDPIPGVKVLVMFESKEQVDKAHKLGYLVVTWIWPSVSPDICRQKAETGADVLITDEIVLWNNYPEGLQEAVRKFNNCRDVAKEVNPNILVGDVEPFWEFLKAFMENGAYPDFVGGEVYNGDITLERLNQLKQEYGVKTHQWLHGVDPERDLEYIGKVDLAIFADVVGTWKCMNQNCGSYLEELRASAAKKNWRICYKCPWGSNEESCCGDDLKCAGGGVNSCGVFSCGANLTCNDKNLGAVGDGYCSVNCQYYEPFSLSSGWNEVTWPDVSGKKASDIPSECPIAVTKENFWFEPYVRNFGGVNFNFEKNKTYYLKCNQTANWSL